VDVGGVQELEHPSSLPGDIVELKWSRRVVIRKTLV
jgi:hypothetical protein